MVIGDILENSAKTISEKITFLIGKRPKNRQNSIFTKANDFFNGGNVFFDYFLPLGGVFALSRQHFYGNVRENRHFLKKFYGRWVPSFLSIFLQKKAFRTRFFLRNRFYTIQITIQICYFYVELSKKSSSENRWRSLRLNI